MDIQTFCYQKAIKLAHDSNYVQLIIRLVNNLTLSAFSSLDEFHWPLLTACNIIYYNIRTPIVTKQYLLLLLLLFNSYAKVLNTLKNWSHCVVQRTLLYLNKAVKFYAGS